MIKKPGKICSKELYGKINQTKNIEIYVDFFELPTYVFILLPIPSISS
jgi:hypothetical protein